MTNLFIVSDIHGMYPQFQQMLEYWDKESQLVILGDMINRGAYSREVIKKVMDLQQQYGEQVIVLKGNHEDMLGYLLDGKMEPELFLENGGREFMQSFLVNFDEAKLENSLHQLKNQYDKEIQFLRNAHSYYQIGKLLISHAGFDQEKDTWQETEPQNFLWTRKHYEQPNRTGLINIFGHTPTREIHGKDAIWHSTCDTYIGIDGGCAYDGQLNGLFISEDGDVLAEYVVK